MDHTRAHEISESTDMKNVTYNGNRVYIQQVNTKDGTATIYELDNRQNTLDVQVETLQEH